MLTIELAKALGLSTQQVRNYADAGILGAVDRSASGYRIFSEVHVRRARAYRALMVAFGIPRARDILLALVQGDEQRALALIDDAHAELHELRGRADKLERSLDELASADSETARDGQAPQRRSRQPGGVMSITQLAEALGIKASALRVWEHAGLLRSIRTGPRASRRYADDDVRDARAIQLLRENGMLFDGIRPVVEALRTHGDVVGVRQAVSTRRSAINARSRTALAGAAEIAVLLG